MQNFHQISLVTPQNASIPGSKQVKNDASGYSFAVDQWQKLHRFLVLGTEGGTYYASERDLTKESINNVLACIKADGPRVVSLVRDISKAGRAPKNDPALFVLALASAASDKATKELALKAIPEVARIGTHLFHYLNYVQAYRGWGRGLRKAVASWYNDQKAKDLAYQIVKYQQRDGWSHKDALCLAHPKPITGDHSVLFKYVLTDGPFTFVGLDHELVTKDTHDIVSYLFEIENLKKEKDAAKAAEVIRKYNFPREVVPTELLTKPEVWAALLENMPITAMVRNLGTMSKVGLLTPLSDASAKVVAKLSDGEVLRKSRIHPMQILAAIKTYSSGTGVRGGNTWTPVAEVIDALDKAFYASIDYVKPTGKKIVVGIDVSGSMANSTAAGIPGMSAAEAAAAMALILAKTEPNVAFVAFDTVAHKLTISKSMRLDTVTNQIRSLISGGTDCAVPIHWAEKNKIAADAIIVLTDSQTWYGRVHPSQAIEAYRRNMSKPESKLITVAMATNDYTLSDENDAQMMSVVGMDTATPQLINDFIGGNL